MITKRKRVWKKRTPAEQARDREAARLRRKRKAQGEARPARARKAARRLPDLVGSARSEGALKTLAQVAGKPVKGKAAKVPKASQGGSRTAYRLVDGIPEAPRAGTTGREILDAIKAAGQSTIPELIGTTKAPPATVRKWVHMLRQVKAVESVRIEAGS